MREASGISRRKLLQLAGAAGAFATTGGLRRVWTQGGARIERLAPELDAVVSTSAAVQELASGLGGALGPAEGPVWWKEGGYLLFSDIHNDKRMKYSPE